MFALFCGSREWLDPEPIRAAILKLPEDATIIHGEARGADIIADIEARKAGRSIISIPADWDAGPAAGPIRNDQLLARLLAARKFEQPVRGFAFHHDFYLGVGTRDMVRKMLRARVRVEVFLSNEPEMRRVNGEVECEDCGLKYRKHPSIMSILDWKEEPFLRLSCDGLALKL